MAAVRHIDQLARYTAETLPAECGTKHIRGENKACPICRVARGGVEFIAELPPAMGRTLPRPAWLVALRDRPGEWARVEVRATRRQAANRARTLRKSPGLRGYQIACRDFSILARYVGDPP